MENDAKEFMPEEVQPEDDDDGEIISTISIIPVISICLVLLVVMMMTAPLMNIPNLEVDLPHALTEETKERNITVTCAADGTIAIKTHIVTRETFVERFKYELKNADNPLVIIRADKDLPYGEVEKILKIIKKAGAKRIAFGTVQKVIK